MAESTYDMPTMMLYRPAYHLDQTDLEIWAGAAHDAGIAVIEWSPPSYMRSLIISPGELCGVLRGAGVRLTKETAYELGRAITDELPASAQQDELWVPADSFTIGQVRTKGQRSLRYLGVAAANPVVMCERQAVQRLVEQRHGLPAPSPLWRPDFSPSICIARSRLPDSLERLQALLEQDTTILPERVLYGLPDLENF